MDEAQEKPRKTALLLYSIFVCVAGNSLLYGYNIGILNATWKHTPELSTFIFDAGVKEREHKPCTTKSTLLENRTHSTNFPLFENKSTGSSVETPLEKCTESKTQQYGVFPVIYGLYVLVGSALVKYRCQKKCKNALLIFPPTQMCLATICGVMTVVAPKSYIFGYSNRLFIAIHSGSSTTIAFLYITGIVSKRDRLFAGNCHKASIAIGFLMSMIFLSQQHAGFGYMWFVLFGFNAAVTLIFMVTFSFCPESPRQLLKKEDESQTKTVLRKLRGIDDVEDELEEMQEEIRMSSLLNRLSFKQLIISPELRTSTIAAIISKISQQLAGLSVIMIYSNIVFTRAGIQERVIPLLNIALGVCLCLGVVISWGGKGSCLKMKCCMFIAATALVVCLSLHQPKDEITFTTAMSILALLLYMLFYPKAFGLGTASRSMTDNFPEIACRKMKILVNIVGTLSNATFLFVFPRLENYLQSYTYVIFAVAILVSILTTWFINPKNTGQDESIMIDGSLERLRDENERLREVVICNRCNAKTKSILYNQCGHVLYCSSCDISVYAKHCPECQEPIRPYTHVKFVPEAPMPLQDMANTNV